jgi:hypothetical protein
MCQALFRLLHTQLGVCDSPPHAYDQPHGSLNAGTALRREPLCQVLQLGQPVSVGAYRSVSIRHSGTTVPREQRFYTIAEYRMGYDWERILSGQPMRLLIALASSNRCSATCTSCCAWVTT